MSVIPGLELELDHVEQHLCAIVDQGKCQGVQYTSSWLHGGQIKADGKNAEEPFILSFAIFYPEVAHTLGGYMVSKFAPDADHLGLMNNMELDDRDIANDARNNAAIREKLTEKVRDSGGLMASVSEKCDRLRVPLWAMVLWVEGEDEVEPAYASLHSVATLPPLQVLKSMKFALWERTSS